MKNGWYRFKYEDEAGNYTFGPNEYLFIDGNAIKCRNEIGTIKTSGPWSEESLSKLAFSSIYYEEESK